MALGETMQVWRWTVRNEPPVQLTHVPGDVTKYEWRRDASGLVLTVQRKRNADEVRNIAEHGVLYDGNFPVWNRQSTVDAVLEWKPEEDETWLYSLANSEERRATPEEAKAFGPWQSDLKDKVLTRPQDLDATHHILDAKISPDRSSVAYRYFLDDPAQSQQISYVLYVKPIRGGTPLRLTSLTGYAEDYWWSRDSKRIYYTLAGEHGHAPSSWVTPADGSPARTLVGTTDYLDQLSMDGSERYVVCTRENNATPPQIGLVDLGSGQFHILVDLNPEFQNIRLSPVSRMEGVNHFGEAWFGQLVMPLQYEPGKRYPLIITTYRSGDYFLRGASGDQSPIQVYAAHGFVVLSLDVGVVKDPKDFDGFRMLWSSPVASMEQAVSRLAESGLVDPERVGATGYSYGETILGYAIGHTDLIRAASGVASYDPFFEHYLVDRHFRVLFEKWGLGSWTDPSFRQNWSEVSLLLQPERVHAPVLNQAGDFEGLGDLPLFVALNDLKRPVELYLYPNELHHKNQPKHRLEIYERNLAWFRFWLKDEEDPATSKEEQYERWRHLRKDATVTH
jgi:dipeptidyl aminopeptidase/acylaminoacyl peptidase